MTVHPNLIGGRDVLTDFIYPPIPIRSNDWCACFDPEVQPYGYGSTEQEAIEDLRQLFNSGFFDDTCRTNTRRS